MEQPIAPTTHTEATSEPTLGGINGPDEYKKLYIKNNIFDDGVVLTYVVRSYWIRIEQVGDIAAIVQSYYSEELYDVTICLYDESGNLITTGITDEEYQLQFVYQHLTPGDYYISTILIEDYTGDGFFYGFMWDYVSIYNIT